MNEDTNKPQPWHPADEKPRADGKGGAPLGTHSLTGGNATVGLPPTAADPEIERSDPRDEPPGAEEPGPLSERRTHR